MSLTEASGAVFLSYASQDAQAAQRICEALRAAGIEVWFDQSELRGGDAWDLKIRQQIRDCALFLPIISEHTTERPEGYFRLEWGLADQRSQMIARNKAFIIPVCVDRTSESVPDLPESFLRVQWMRLPDGSTPAGFCERIAVLLGRTVPTAPRANPGPAATAMASVPRPRSTVWLLGAVGVLVAVLAGVLLVLKPWRPAAKGPDAQFGAPDALANSGRAAMLVSGRAAGAAPERSIAVLPFTDMSEKKDQEYFSDGLSEELIDLLTKVPDLRVPARTSSFYFKDHPAPIGEIAHALSVAYVLEGSVRKAGNTIRVTAQLIRADGGYHVWSETYDRDLKDVFKVQDEIAGRVLDELKLSLPAATGGSTGRTENGAAHNQYLLGRKALDVATAESYQTAVDFFKQAIALDPGYAAAYSSLATAEANFADMSGERSGFDRASAAAEHAIQLAPGAADGYIARGHLRSTFFWDWGGARSDFDKALAIDPNNSEALFESASLLETEGQFALASSQIDKAIAIDPLLTRLYSTRAHILLDSGKLAEARDAFQQLLKVSPDHPHANVDLAELELLDHHPEQAAADLQRPAAPGWRLIGTAEVEHTLGHAPQAQQALDEVIRDSAQFAAYQIAEIYAWRGQKDQAFQWLDRAYAQSDGGLTEVKVDPLLASLRGDPRYDAFLSKMKLR
ncbi:MAG TPA: TIR domain-containing protein [Steroidobacteraceae bacterium]|jgi:TolB-like protein/thioredoxin-like negative regulator of GroEL